MNTTHTYLPQDVINEVAKEAEEMTKKIDHTIQECLSNGTPRMKVSSMPELVCIGRSGYERDIAPAYGESVRWLIIDGEEYLEFSV